MNISFLSRTSSIPFLSAIGQKTLSSSKLDIMGVLSCIGLLYKSDVKTRLEVAVFCQFHANTIAIFLFSALILVSNLVIMHIVCCSCLAIYVAILCVLSHDFAVVTVSLPYMLCDASSDTCFISFLLYVLYLHYLSQGSFGNSLSTSVEVGVKVCVHPILPRPHLCRITRGMLLLLLHIACCWLY